MQGPPLRLPDCGAPEALPYCGLLKRVVNLSSLDVRVEFQVPGVAAGDGWAPVVPLVRAGRAHEPANGVVALPRGCRIRTVNAREPEGPGSRTLRDFGVLGDSMIVVQPPDE